MSEIETPKHLRHGEEGEESEEEYPGEVETEENDEEEDEGEEEEKEEVKEPVVKPVKKRRCRRRKKISVFEFYDEDEDEEVEETGKEEAEEEEDEEEEEGDEGEEMDVISGASVLSAITFEWEDTIYEFEELCDPGKIETIFHRKTCLVGPTSLFDIGAFRYMEMCKSLKIVPTMRILDSLNRQEIDLSYRNIQSSSIRAMCAALETNNSVKRLIMKYNKLKLEDCRYIGIILYENEKISELDFTGCRVGPGGLELLITNLGANEIVNILKIAKCDIGDEGIKVLVPILTRNTGISELDLSYNNLGEEAAEALAQALKVNNCLKELKLRYNKLFDAKSMKSFFRSLSLNKSISHLDLSWNGLNGVEMAGLIRNYLRKSESLVYLDLSDNRFQGEAVMELKKGLAKSKVLEVLKLGKNPMLPDDLDAMLSGAIASPNLQVLDLEDLWANKSFLKILKKLEKQGREMEVKYAGVLGNYEVFGPDYPKVILQRAQFEAQKPKKQKKKRDFGHLMWTLGDEPMTKDEFMLRVKKFKAKINKELYPELINQFTIPKVQLIDVVAMRAKYLSIFPDSTPPPPPKGKKGMKGEPVPKVEEKPVEPDEEEGEFEFGGEDDEDEFIIGDFEDGEEWGESEEDEEYDEGEDEEDEEEDEELDLDEDKEHEVKVIRSSSND